MGQSSSFDGCERISCIREIWTSPFVVEDWAEQPDVTNEAVAAVPLETSAKADGKSFFVNALASELLFLLHRELVVLLDDRVHVRAPAWQLTAKIDPTNSCVLHIAPRSADGLAELHAVEVIRATFPCGAGADASAGSSALATLASRQPTFVWDDVSESDVKLKFSSPDDCGRALRHLEETSKQEASRLMSDLRAFAHDTAQEARREEAKARLRYGESLTQHFEAVLTNWTSPKAWRGPKHGGGSAIMLCLAVVIVVLVVLFSGRFLQ